MAARNDMTAPDDYGNEGPTSPVQETWIIMGVLAVGLLVRLVLAWADVTTLIQKTMPDDAYYYFVVARNAIQGRGVSVDGLYPTNGFHPLWLLALLIPFGLCTAWCTGPDLPIHLSLSLAAVFDMLTAFVAYRLVSRFRLNRWAGVLTAAFYALNPLIIMESVNGLETSLSTLMFALCLYHYLTRVRDVLVARSRDYVILGLLGGLMFLSRTDTIFLLVLIGLDLLRSARRGRLSSLLAVGLAALFVVSPWLAWSQLALGTVVQSSGVAFPYLIHQAIYGSLAAGYPFGLVLNHYMLPVAWLSALTLLRYGGVAGLAILLCWGSVRFFQPRLRPVTPSQAKTSRPWVLPLLAVLLSILVHTFYRWYPRSWYFVPLAFALALWVGPAVVHSQRRLGALSGPARHLPWVWAGLGFLVFVLLGVREWRTGFYPWQTNMYQGAWWVAQNVAPDTVIGSFNAGFNAYYSAHPVVNLDGVTDWKALQALQSHSLLAYAGERGVKYVVDYETYIVDSYRSYWGQGFPEHLRRVQALSPPFEPYGAVVLYRLEAQETSGP